MTIISIYLGKIISWFLKTFHLGAGATWPGEIVLRLNKNFIKQMQSRLKKGIVVISGTNGKTTTAALISEILKKNRIKILNNPSGANLLNGIASAFIRDAKLNGKLRSNLAVFEIDEANLPLVLKHFNPKIILLLNLSRDQLDRYGEVEIILEKWKHALSLTNNKTKIIINEDDLRLYKFAEQLKQPVIYFKYESKHKWLTKLLGKHNKLNVNAALQVAKIFNTPHKRIEKALINFQPAFGRGEMFKYNDRKLKMFLAKNPASFNSNLTMINDEFIKKDKKIAALLFILNDNIPDGRDVSWIYDIRSSLLEKACKNTKIFIAGTRQLDMALRLKYAGVDYCKFWHSNDITKMIKTMCQQTNRNELCIILPTYSAMLQSRKILCGKSIL